MYRPLPDCVTIKKSDIEGLGLFATKFIKEGTVIGKTHFYYGDELERTPLGGFINHSESPNCNKMQMDSRFFLVALRDILVGEEITLQYTFYEV